MRLIFDIESDNLLDDVTVIHCMWTYDLDTKEYRGFRPDEIEDGIKHLQSADLVIGHNIYSFDLPAIEKLYPGFKRPKWFDTLLASRLIWTNMLDIDARNRKAKRYEMPGQLVGKHSLKAWGHRVGLLKGDFGDTTDWSEWTPEMHTYCLRDVDVTLKLWELIEKQNYPALAFETEHRFAEIIHLQEQFGFPFNESEAGKLYGMLAGKREELRLKLVEVFEPTITTMKKPEYYLAGGNKYPTVGAARKAKYKREDITDGPPAKKVTPFNPASRQQIADRLQKQFGWKPDRYTDKGQVQIDETTFDGMEWPEAKLLAEYFTVNKLIGMLAEGDNSWLKLVRKDGRIHGSVVTNGAVTGRCTHNSPNVTQVPKHDKRKPEAMGKECRSLFGPPKGWKLVGCDASGLELRGLSHFLARLDGGKYVREVVEGDVHTANQHAGDLDTRDDAKTFIYAYCYGAGDHKLGTVAGLKPGDIERFKASPDWKRIRKKYESDDASALHLKGTELRAKFETKIDGMGELIEQVKTGCGFVRHPKGFWTKDPTAKKRWLGGLDGRRLHVRSAHSALNTLIQSSGAVLMKWALILLKEWCDNMQLKHGEDYAFVANVHDEFQIAVNENGPAGITAVTLGQQAVHAIRKAAEKFSFRCPLDGEYRVGNNWHETH